MKKDINEATTVNKLSKGIIYRVVHKHMNRIKKPTVLDDLEINKKNLQQIKYTKTDVYKGSMNW